MSILLASVAEAKDFIGGFTSTTSDERLTVWMQGLSAVIERHLNRNLKQQAFTEFFDSDGLVRAVWVKGLPIAATPAVQVFSDAERVFGATTEVDSKDYAVYPEEGRIELDTGSTFAVGKRSIKVAYTGGFLEALGVLAVPDDLKQAFLIQLRFEWENQGKIGLTGESTGPGSQVTLMEPYDFQPAVKRILGPFRRMGWQ